MYNLAGNKQCDKRIEKELHKADINIIRHAEPLSQEVPASLTGKLGDKFTFTRAWYYWVVNGPVPLNIAEEMYENPNGREDVRVMGHCLCPPPSDWERDGFINIYHIDSQEGLNMFVQTLKHHNLVGEKEMNKEDRGANTLDRILVWLRNFRHIHHRLMADFIRNRGWVAFYLDEELRTCESDSCWLNLYQAGEVRERS